MQWLTPFAFFFVFLQAILNSSKPSQCTNSNVFLCKIVRPTEKVPPLIVMTMFAPVLINLVADHPTIRLQYNPMTSFYCGAVSTKCHSTIIPSSRSYWWSETKLMKRQPYAAREPLSTGKVLSRQHNLGAGHV